MCAYFCYIHLMMRTPKLLFFLFKDGWFCSMGIASRIIDISIDHFCSFLLINILINSGNLLTEQFRRDHSFHALPMSINVSVIKTLNTLRRFR